jgi:hypothetical protein
MAAAAVQVNPAEAGAKLTFPYGGSTFQTNDHVKSGAGGAAVVTLNADASRPIFVKQLVASYDSAPTGGLLTISDGTLGVVWEQAITGAGPVQFNFDPPRCGSKNSTLTITLAAGGGSILARLDVNAYVEV